MTSTKKIPHTWYFKLALPTIPLISLFIPFVIHSYRDRDRALLLRPFTIPIPAAAANHLHLRQPYHRPHRLHRRALSLIDEFHLENHLSFLNEGPKSPDFYNPHQDLASTADWGGTGSKLHRRSCSVSDLDPSFGSDADPGFGYGWKPCLYYARWYCKNGSSCRFIHGADADVGSDTVVGSSEQCHELLRSKSLQQQRLAAASQLMASSTSPYSALAANKCLNLLLQQQQIDSPRGGMMGDDMLKFGRSRLDWSDFPMNGGVGQFKM